MIDFMVTGRKRVPAAGNRSNICRNLPQASPINITQRYHKASKIFLVMKIFSAKIMSVSLMSGSRLCLRKTAVAAFSANIAYL
jgi:hypothetical protein